jgi:predicted MPP superfamily phosphohydrolase
MPPRRGTTRISGIAGAMAMLAVFLLLYAGMHVYAFAKIQAALSPDRTVALLVAAWLALMTALPLMVWRWEKHGWHFLTRIGAWVGYCWMGFLFLFFWIALAFDGYQALSPDIAAALHRQSDSLSLSDSSAFVAAVLLAAGAAVYGYFEARAIRVEHIRLRTTKLPPSVGRVNIVQISDLHLGALVGARRLRPVLARIQALQPDMLVSTGDLLDGQADQLDGLTQLFGAIAPRFGKYAVTGNHEFFAGIDRALDFTARAGFVVLRGESVTTVGGITVAGVDDPAGTWMGATVRVDEKRLLSALPHERFTLLLKHQPIVGHECAGLFDLQLSGHTHQGQIFPFGLIVRIAYRARSGLTSLMPHGHLYLSRGTGTWGPPLRVLAPPEITLIEIEAAE